VSLDTSGVGQLVEIGVRKGRAAKPGLKIGVCGEHGGDPASIRFFHGAGLDYVSCSPYRVPIARLAAAQAQLEKPSGIDPPLLTYFRSVNGKIEQQEFEPELLTEDAFHWIDLEDPTVKEATILEDPFHFHPLAIEDCLAEVHHPKIDDYESYIFVIVHGIRFDAPNDQFITRELDIFLGKNYLITHHKGPMRSINTLREQCSKNLISSFPRAWTSCCTRSWTCSSSTTSPTSTPSRTRSSWCRSRSSRTPRARPWTGLPAQEGRPAAPPHLRPQREIVNRLARASSSREPAAAVYFRDIYDNLYRIVEASFSYQDIVQSLLDAYLSAVSNRLNETMKRLTVIGAIMAALTVITGVYGMNFEFMPELHWRFGYVFVWASCSW
jgi:magnesium transporter